MNTNHTNTTGREAAVTGLAIVGFIALVAAGMWLAVYSARYMPTIANRLGAAAVSLGSVFGSDNSPSLSVVPTASTTIPFGNGTSTQATSTPAATSTTGTNSGSHPATPSAGPKTSTTTATGGAPSYYGLPDLAVSITATGYLSASTTDSFVAATTIPRGSTPAVKFMVKNVGTNIAGSWRFSASLPTTSNPIYQSIAQQSLNPGDYIEFTLGFTQASAGSNKMISVTVDPDNAISESNENNSVSTQVTILGS